MVTLEQIRSALEIHDLKTADSLLVQAECDHKEQGDCTGHVSPYKCTRCRQLWDLWQLLGNLEVEESNVSSSTG